MYVEKELTITSIETCAVIFGLRFHELFWLDPTESAIRLMVFSTWLS